MRSPFLQPVEGSIDAFVTGLFGADCIVLSPVFLKALNGDHAAAVLLSAVASGTEQSADAEGWFPKTFDQWHDEVCLTRFQVERAAKALAPFGVERQVRRVDNSPVAFYRLRSDVLATRIMEGVQA